MVLHHETSDLRRPLLSTRYTLITALHFPPPPVEPGSSLKTYVRVRGRVERGKNKVPTMFSRLAVIAVCVAVAHAETAKIVVRAISK